MSERPPFDLGRTVWLAQEADKAADRNFERRREKHLWHLYNKLCEDGQASPRPVKPALEWRDEGGRPYAVADDSGAVYREGQTGDAPAQHVCRRPEYIDRARALATFDAHCASLVGTFEPPAKFEKRQRERAILAAQAGEIAAALDEEGFGGTRTQADGWSLWKYFVHTGELQKLPNYARKVVNPVVAAQTRANKLAAAEYLEMRSTYAFRFWTFTSGKRCTAKHIRRRLRWIHRQISRLNVWLKRNGWPLEIVLRSSELGTLENRKDPEAEGVIERDSQGRVYYHPHTHCLVRQTAWIESSDWSEKLLPAIKAFWRHNWDEGGAVENIREAIKYVTKPSQIVQLARKNRGEFRKLVEATAKLKMVQPLGELKREIAARNAADMMLVREKTPDGYVWREIKDPNKGAGDGSKVYRRVKLKRCGGGGDHRHDAMPEVEVTNAAARRLFTTHHYGPAVGDKTSLEVCRVVARCMPCAGSFGVKEPVAVVMGTHFDRKQVDTHPLIARLRLRTADTFRAGWLDCMQQRAALGLRVHTGTPTAHPAGAFVPDPQKPPPERQAAEVFALN